MSDTTFDDEDAPDAVLIQAFETYADAGLRLPPVPHSLVAALDDDGEWFYATAACDLTDREAFLDRARAAEADPFVAFGHVGHGQASWYLCYQLVDGPLAVFVRQRYGSPYEDGETERDIVNAVMERIEELVVYADAAAASGRFGNTQRLIVVLDDSEPGGWELLGKTGWHESETPLLDAVKLTGAS
jgi:hypothetical protein